MLTLSSAAKTQSALWPAVGERDKRKRESERDEKRGGLKQSEMVCSRKDTTEHTLILAAPLAYRTVDINIICSR